MVGIGEATWSVVLLGVEYSTVIRVLDDERCRDNGINWGCRAGERERRTPTWREQTMEVEASGRHPRPKACSHGEGRISGVVRACRCRSNRLRLFRAGSEAAFPPVARKLPNLRSASVRRQKPTKAIGASERSSHPNAARCYPRGEPPVMVSPIPARCAIADETCVFVYQDTAGRPRRTQGQHHRLQHAGLQGFHGPAQIRPLGAHVRPLPLHPAIDAAL